MVRKLKPRPAFSDYLASGNHYVDNTRISRPNAVYHYPFRDDQGSIGAILKCDVEKSKPDFCLMGFSARKRLALNVFKEMCIGSTNSHMYLTKMNISDIPKALTELGFKISQGLQDAFIVVGSKIEEQPGKLKTTISENQWLAIVHRFVFAELTRRKADRLKGAGIAPEGEVSDVNLKEIKNKIHKSVSKKVNFKNNHSSSIPTRVKEFKLDDKYYSTNFDDDDDENDEEDTFRDSSSVDIKEEIFSEIDFAEWEQSEGMDVLAEVETVMHRKEDTDAVYGLLQDTSRLKNAQKSNNNNNNNNNKPKVKQYAVAAATSKESEKPVRKCLLPKSDQIVYIPKIIKTKKPHAESKLKNFIRADKVMWQKNENAQKSAILKSVASNKFETIVSTSKFPNSEIDYNRKNQYPYGDHDDDDDDDDDNNYEQEIAYAKEKVSKVDYQSGKVKTFQDYINGFGDLVSEKENESDLSPRKVSTNKQSKSFVSEPDIYSLDIVDSFLKGSFMNQFLQHNDEPRPDKPSSSFPIRREVTKGAYSGNNSDIYPEGWKATKGGWVADFGPLHKMKSSLRPEKTSRYSYESSLYSKMESATNETNDHSKKEEEEEEVVVSGSVSFIASATQNESHQSSEEEEEDLSEFSTLNINREVKNIKV